MVFFESEDYASAIEYAKRVIASDPDYKYAYDTLGLALHAQGNLQEALETFDRALVCDPGYADAKIHRLEVLTAIARQISNFDQVPPAFQEAARLEKTDYDQRKKAELEAIARSSRPARQPGSAPMELQEPIHVEMPKQEFEAGSPEYVRRLEGLEAAYKKLQKELEDLEHRQSRVEERMGLLSGEVLELKDSLGIITKTVAGLDAKIAVLETTDPMVELLKFERGKLLERETHIKEFNKNEDLRHYFYALLSEIEASYIATQAIESGKLLEKKTETFSKAGEHVGNVLEMIPVIGKAASILIKGAGSIADMGVNVKEKISFMRIRNLAPTIEVFDQIAIRVAVECTLKHQDFIKTLEKEQVPRDWKAKIEALKDGLEGLITKFLEDNKTQAKVLGRLDAYKVLAYLQQEAVAENLSVLQDEEVSSPTRKRKASLIGSEISSAVFKFTPSQGTHSSPAAPVSSDELTTLIEQCRKYSLDKPDKLREKTRAAYELQALLERREKGEVTSQTVIDYVDAALSKESNPIFACYLGKNAVQVLFESARDCMSAVG